MKIVKGLTMLGIGLWLASNTLAAGLYGWTDASGVRHFSNTPPNEGVGQITEVVEMPHDAQSDLKRDTDDRQALEKLLQQNAMEAEAQERQKSIEEQARSEPPAQEPLPLKKVEKTAAKRERLIEAGKKLNAPKSQVP